jgi:hypothetical protein
VAVCSDKSYIVAYHYRKWLVSVAATVASIGNASPYHSKISRSLDVLLPGASVTIRASGGATTSWTSLFQPATARSPRTLSGVTVYYDRLACVNGSSGAAGFARRFGILGCRAPTRPYIPHQSA